MQGGGSDVGIPQLLSHFDDVSGAVTLKGSFVLFPIASTAFILFLLPLCLHPLCEERTLLAQEPPNHYFPITLCCKSL